MYGEHFQVLQRLVVSRGSSPHVRGARGLRRGVVPGRGIIPACTGSTRPATPGAWTTRDHPRMYGEHSLPDGSCRSCQGSSPHVRGALYSFSLSRYYYRDHPRMYGEHYAKASGSMSSMGIIPACTGSTDLRGGPGRPAGDHPRMYGEHSSVSRTMQPKPGSSPHVRGALVGLGFSGVTVGIIPACTGSTGHDVHGRGAHRDHPRMYGEHLR